MPETTSMFINNRPARLPVSHMPLVARARANTQRMAGGWLARLMHRLPGTHDPQGSFERVDSAALEVGGFRASDSMGLDGAPAMVFTDNMPAYSYAIDRPLSRVRFSRPT
jgi:hypothetical protein